MPSVLTPATAVAEIERLQAALTAERARTRAWREAFHSLRGSLEGRLERIAEALEEIELEED